VTDGSRITETTQRLVEDLRPVRRLWSPGARTALWVALEALMLLYLLATRARGDLGALLTMPSVLLELATVVTASILLARLAFCELAQSQPRACEIDRKHRPILARSVSRGCPA
jgi:hypothetical protein